MTDVHTINVNYHYYLFIFVKYSYIKMHWFLHHQKLPCILLDDTVTYSN